MHLNPATLIGTHKYRIDLLRTEHVLMFVDLHYDKAEYCVRALNKGLLNFDRSYYLGWFTHYDAAYKMFDDLNTGRVGPTDRYDREQNVAAILQRVGELT